MYDSDGAVEKDVALLRRRLKEVPVEQQAYISRHISRPFDGVRNDVWWVVSVPATPPSRTARTWFYLEKDKGGGGRVQVKDPSQNMKLLATVDTVEAAYFAGAILIERPS
jgi:hypothetical protein